MFTKEHSLSEQSDISKEPLSNAALPEESREVNGGVADDEPSMQGS